MSVVSATNLAGSGRRLFALALALTLCGGSAAQAENERPGHRQSARSSTALAHLVPSRSASEVQQLQARSGCAQPRGAERHERELLERVNAERARRGLHRLQYNPRLQQAARIIACDNAGRDRMSHTESRGRGLAARLDAVGYNFRAASENITMRRGGADEAVRSWIGSGGHYSNMMNPAVREFGGSVTLASSGQVYWVVVHGAE